MNIVFSVFIFLFLLTACSDKDKMPADVLPPNKMREVMWDMVRAGEFLNAFVLQRDSSVDKAAESQKWYSKIYKLHNTNKEQFEKSFTYYKEHPLMMKAIFDTLSKRQVDASHASPSVEQPDGSPGPRLDSLKPRDSLRNRFDTLIKKKILKRKERLVS